MIASCCVSRTHLGWANRMTTARCRFAQCSPPREELPNELPIVEAQCTRQMDEELCHFLTCALFCRHGGLSFGGGSNHCFHDYSYAGTYGCFHFCVLLLCLVLLFSVGCLCACCAGLEVPRTRSMLLELFLRIADTTEQRRQKFQIHVHSTSNL